MRNLRQRLGAMIGASMIAMILGATTPAFADGLPLNIGGSAKNTCAFVAGMLFKVPPDSAAASMFRAVALAFDCD